MPYRTAFRGAPRISLFEALVEGAVGYAIFLLDPHGAVLSWNRGAARLKGYSEEEILGRSFSCFYTAEDAASGHPARSLAEAQAHGKFEEEGWRVRGDGTLFLASVLIIPVRDSDGCLAGFCKMTRDVTELRQAQDALIEGARALLFTMDAIPHMVWMASPRGTLTYTNRRCSEYLGPDFKGADTRAGARHDWSSVLHPDDLGVWLEAFGASVASGTASESKCRFRNAGRAGYRWHLTRMCPLRDDKGLLTGWLGTSTDIDDLENLSRRLEQSVEARTRELNESLIEKTTLLKEVHHRVKNNLQVVCSLLSMQLEAAGGDPLSNPLNDAHRRVLAMSLIHEQIYRTQSLSELDFGAYIQELAAAVFDAYCLNSSQIRLELDLEPIRLGLHAAIPCGLILNELVSNSLKHAFPRSRAGVLRISFHLLESGEAELAVADNGAGLPPGTKWDECNSLGLQVVRTLVTQLGARSSVRQEDGFEFRLRWRPALLA